MSDLQHQRLAELSRELRLSAVPDLYSAIAQSAAAKAASFADFLEEILRAERDARRARAREMFARVAGFPVVKTLDGFDFGFATGVGERGELPGIEFLAERGELLVQSMREPEVHVISAQQNVIADREPRELDITIGFGGGN